MRTRENRGWSVLVLALVLSPIAAACSSGEDPAGTDQGDTEDAAAEAGESEGEDDDSAPDCPAAPPGSSDEIVEIRVDMYGGGSEVPEADVIGPALNEAVGIELTISPMAALDDHDARLSTDLVAGASGELLHLMSRSRLEEFVSQGLLLDITDCLDEHLPDFVDWVGEENLEAVTFDGRVYGTVKQPQDNYRSLWIRQDWLDNLGLDIPETMDELAEVLEAFTTQDPNETGRNDTVGLTGPGLPTLEMLWPGFGSGGPGNFYNSNGELTNGYYDPALRDALAFVNEQFEAGVIDPDLFTLDLQAAIDRVAQGAAGVIVADFGQMGRAAEHIEIAQPDAELVQIPNPDGPGGPGLVAFPPFPTHFFGIPASLADEPETLAKVFELVNYVSAPEGRELTAYGIEGVDWEMVDGEPKLTEEALAKSEEERGFTWMYQLAGRDEARYLKRGGTPYTGDQVDFAVGHPVLPIYNTLVTNPEGYNPADATRYGEEELIQFITGQRPLDEYDDFLATLSTTFGYQEYVDHATAQLGELGLEE